MTSVEISERAFEDTIEADLLQVGPDAPAGAVHLTAGTYGDMVTGNYRRRTADDYDRELCLIPRDVLDFVYATQPKEWKSSKVSIGVMSARGS